MAEQREHISVAYLAPGDRLELRSRVFLVLDPIYIPLETNEPMIFLEAAEAVPAGAKIERVADLNKRQFGHCVKAMVESNLVENQKVIALPGDRLRLFESGTMPAIEAYFFKACLPERAQGWLRGANAGSDTNAGNQISDAGGMNMMPLLEILERVDINGFDRPELPASASGIDYLAQSKKAIAKPALALQDSEDTTKQLERIMEKGRKHLKSARTASVTNRPTTL